jgi:hypothetical protein
MNKKLIRLTESDLHRIVKESVNRILMESKGLDPSKLKTNQDEWLRNYAKEDYNPFDNDDFEEWDRTNVSPISDEEYNEIMRMNPMQNSSYIFNKIGFNKWNGFVSRWGKENPEECERFWQSMMAF